MASVNKVILIGNLGRDPEIRHTQSGTPVTNFTMATTDQWKDQQTGERHEKTEWHRIVVWGKQAEIVNEYCRKGRQVYVEGSLQTREWTDREGVKKYTTEVKAQRVQMLGRRDEAAAAPAQTTQVAEPAPGGGASGGGGGYEEDDIPF